MNYSNITSLLLKNQFKPYTNIPENMSGALNCFIYDSLPFARVIVMVDNTKYFFNGNTLEKLESEILRNLYFSSFTDIKVLFLICTDNIERDRLLISSSADIWFIDEICKRLICYDNQPEDFCGLRKYMETALEADGNVKNSFKNLLRSSVPYITVILTAINIIVFIYTEIAGSSYDTAFMLNAGAACGPLIFEYGQYYRFFTSMFLHFGIEHLVNNMFMLVLIGNELEQAAGHLKFTILYLISGLVSSAVSSYIYYITDETVISAGASGAIMGVMGALAVYLITNRRLINKSRGIRFLIVAIITISNGFQSSGVDNIAHISGFAAGCLIMLFYKFINNCKQTSD